MLDGILCLFFIQENPGLQHLAEEITKKFGKKSDRVIGNLDLIANPFFQDCF